MESIEINKYIDFNKLFNDLYADHEVNISAYTTLNVEAYKKLFDFHCNAKKDFELIEDECELSDEKIVFVFGYNFNDANESCTQSTTAEYVIVFTRRDDDFTSCDYQQG